MQACESMDQSLLGPSVHDILRQEHWSGLPCSSAGDFPDTGKPASPVSPALAGGFFTTSATWETPS